MLHEALEQLRRDAPDLAVVAAIEVGDEEVDERWDVFASLAQRRNDDRDDFQSVGEIPAENPLPAEDGPIACRRGAARWYCSASSSRWSRRCGSSPRSHRRARKTREPGIAPGQLRRRWDARAGAASAAASPAYRTAAADSPPPRGA